MSISNGLKISGAIAFLFFALPAMAQFEVSPDHFDAADQKAPAIAHKAAVHRPSTTLAARNADLQSAPTNAQHPVSTVGVVPRHNQGPSGASKTATSAAADSKPKPKRQVATTSAWARQPD